MVDKGFKLRIQTVVLDVPEWDALPPALADDSTVFLTLYLYERDYKAGVAELSKRLRTALATGHITGRCAPAVSMPLAIVDTDSQRILLGVYLRSALSMEEMNKIIGEEYFYAEGTLGADLRKQWAVA